MRLYKFILNNAISVVPSYIFVTCSKFIYIYMLGLLISTSVSQLFLLDIFSCNFFISEETNLSSCKVCIHFKPTCASDDECLSGMTYWQGRCYIFYPNPMNVTEARDTCHRKYSTLATVDSTEEMSWMMARLFAVHDVTTWHMSEFL